MYVQVATHTVTGAVQIVQTVLPQANSRQNIQTMSLHAGRENTTSQTDVAFHHAGEHLPFNVAWTAEVQRTRNVRSAIQILGTRIAQVDLLDVQRSIRGFGRLVMNDGPIRTGRRDGLERVLNEVLLLLSQFIQLLSGADFGLSAFDGERIWLIIRLSVGYNFYSQFLRIHVVI